MKEIKIRRSLSPKIHQKRCFSKTLRQVTTILKSFQKTPGFGSKLKMLLPAENKASSDAVAAFLLFVLERQKIWVKKSKGKEPLTENVVLGSKWFTNMYRELDRGTIYFRREIIRTTLRGHVISKEIKGNLVKEILFKSILYRLLNKVETFIEFGGIPSISKFSKFLRYLKQSRESGEIIFTAAHQNMGLSRLLKTFEYVKKNICRLTSKVVAAAKDRSSRLCYKAIVSISNVGPFFAWQILTDLLECRVLGVLTDNQWVRLGCGAKKGLRRVFPLNATSKGELKYTRLLRDLCSPAGPGSAFQALGLTFPTFLDKALSLKNVEHALCEYDKYFRSVQGVQVKDRDYSRQKSRVGLDLAPRCQLCTEGEGVRGGGVICALCGDFYHQDCLPAWRGGLHQDGNWLCGECQKYEATWRTEDFSYEEYDESDILGRERRQKKKAARSRNKASKQSGKKPKIMEIERIDLSRNKVDEDEVEIEFIDENLFDYYSYLDHSKNVIIPGE